MSTSNSMGPLLAGSGYNVATALNLIRMSGNISTSNKFDIEATTQHSEELPDMVIGEKVRFSGDLHFRYLLRIDGKVEGHVSASEPNAKLIVGRTGVLVGDISVLQTVVVEGNVIGNIHAVNVILRERAVIYGNITCRAFSSSPKATMKGKIRCGKNRDAIVEVMDDQIGTKKPTSDGLGIIEVPKDDEMGAVEEADGITINNQSELFNIENNSDATPSESAIAFGSLNEDDKEFTQNKKDKVDEELSIKSSNLELEVRDTLNSLVDQVMCSFDNSAIIQSEPLISTELDHNHSLESDAVNEDLNTEFGNITVVNENLNTEFENIASLDTSSEEGAISNSKEQLDLELNNVDADKLKSAPPLVDVERDQEDIKKDHNSNNLENDVVTSIAEVQSGHEINKDDAGESKLTLSADIERVEISKVAEIVESNNTSMDVNVTQGIASIAITNTGDSESFSDMLEVSSSTLTEIANQKENIPTETLKDDKEDDENVRIFKMESDQNDKQADI